MHLPEFLYSSLLRNVQKALGKKRAGSAAFCWNIRHINSVFEFKDTEEYVILPWVPFVLSIRKSLGCLADAVLRDASFL